MKISGQRVIPLAANPSPLERLNKKRLTSDEAGDKQFKADILFCAKVLRKYIRKDKNNMMIVYVLLGVAAVMAIVGLALMAIGYASQDDPEGR